MQIIDPSFVLIDNINREEMLKKIEHCGRVCYKSEDRVTDDSYKKFIAGLIKAGHESVLEHESVTVKFVVSSINDLEHTVEIIKEYELEQKCGVYLSAVFGKIEPAEIVDYMIKKNLNDVNLQLQMHKFIWDPNKRGV